MAGKLSLSLVRGGYYASRLRKMFFPESTTKVWLYPLPTDMRKSFNGLAALVKNTLKENSLSGDLYIFVNRRLTLMKILYFDRNGYCIWYKKLEQGGFQLPKGDGEKIRLDFTQLKLILEGIDLTSVQQRKRYSHSQRLP
ncbi:IS66 family insertion sequence element accessory protein TnpB [Teredinibacter turnerae]|uniref:IS66 family insertion sequence element accessory protein TnpB n=2 Tax=Teredinibacter turnerae TaxID=2426 RepID=UPI0009E226F0